MPFRTTHQPRRAESGRSVIEILIVVTIAAVLGAIAVPQLISARRMLRSSALPRQVLTQFRLVRQQAMSQRQPMTVQYDDLGKRLVIYSHRINPALSSTAARTASLAMLADSTYPSTTNANITSTQVRTISLSGEGLPAGEISYGIPSGASTATLGDNTSLTTLPTSTRRINITFQPDGSVVDSNGNAVNFALYFYNTRATTSTASAVSVLGSGGRVKFWRYDSSANKYVE